MCLLGCANNCLTFIFCILSFIKISNTLISDSVSGAETKSCKFTLNNDEVIDLSPLVNSTQPMTVSTNTILYIYHPCGDVPLNTKLNSDCQKSYGLCFFEPLHSTDKPIDFKKVLSNDTQGNFTLLALNAEAVFRENKLEPPEIVYKHYKNNTVISTYVQLRCSEKVDYKLTIDKSSALEHVLILNSKYVCLNTAHYISGGTIFFIILVVFLIVYFVGGVLVLKFIRGATGIEMLPNHEFWCNLPQLVKDGFKYLINCGKSPPDSYEKI